MGIVNVTDEKLRVIQRKRILSKLDQYELIDRLKLDPATRSMKIRQEGPKILLNTNLSWQSWGEKIRISPQSNVGADYVYEVTSRPRLRTTILDYGKNLDNINRIERALQSAV